MTTATAQQTATESTAATATITGAGVGIPIPSPGDLVTREWENERNRILDKVAGLAPVTDDESCRMARRAQKAVRAHEKALEDDRKSITRNVKKYTDALMQVQRDMTAPLADAYAQLKAATSDYATRVAAEAAAAEAARVAKERALIEAQVRAELEREQAAAAGADPAAVPMPVAPPAAVPGAMDTAPPAPVAPPRPVGAVTVSHLEVWDAALVPRQFLVVDKAALRDYAKYQRSIGAEPTVAGVRFWQTQDVR
jgi:hypothetical protein